MRFSLSHVADQALIRTLSDLVARDRLTTAELLAHLAEVEARRLYLPAGYPSMFEYCVRELKLSEAAAFKRLRAARRARRFPAIFDAVADGRLHLSAVVMLAPHLTRANARELLISAVYKTRAELEKLLAERFPRPDLPTRVLPFGPAAKCAEVAPGPVADVSASVSACGPSECVTLPPTALRPEVAPGPVAGMHAPAARSSEVAPGPPVPVAPRAKVAPLAPERFALQVTIDQETHDLLRRAQELLGHTVPSGDVAEVLKRALQSLVHELEKKKFARAEHPMPRPHADASTGRHIPASVRRSVVQRDGGRCAFVSSNGKRCESRGRLEFDHVTPVARGGQTMAENVRLLCRDHNQYEAERVFGRGFILEKRQEARRSAIEPRSRASRTPEAQMRRAGATERA